FHVAMKRMILPNQRQDCDCPISKNKFFGGDCHTLVSLNEIGRPLGGMKKCRVRALIGNRLPLREVNPIGDFHRPRAQTGVWPSRWTLRIVMNDSAAATPTWLPQVAARQRNPSKERGWGYSRTSLL